MDSKVLILSADYGDGHAQVSHALASQLKNQGVDKVKVVNLMAQSHPLIDAISRQFYLKSYTTLPGIYGWLYHSTKNLPLESKRARWLHSFGLHKMKELLNQEKPDLLIHTFPGSAAAELKRKGQLSLPIFSVLTDFSFHQRWVHKQINRYFVATDQLKEEIAAAGVPSDKVVVTGIPIRSSFEDQEALEPLYKKYGLSPHKKILLVLAGAYGVSSDVKKMCEGLKVDANSEIVLVCGKNKALEADMKQTFKGYNQVKVMGYVNTLHELMKISTCLVSKPGGVTISEAIANGLPLIFFPPVSGQEAENAHFLERKGAAFILKRSGNTGQQVHNLMEHEQVLTSMRERSEALHVSNASHNIAENIAAYLQETSRSFSRQHS